MNKIKSSNLKGFTLIELIIVIAIILILLGTTTYAINGMMKNNKTESADNNAKIMHMAISNWLIDMEASGEEVFVPNDYYTSYINAGGAPDTKYATICGYQFERVDQYMYGQTGDVYPGSAIYPGGPDGCEVNVNGTMVGWKVTNPFCWMIKDWMGYGDAQFNMHNGLGSFNMPDAKGNYRRHGFTGSRVNPMIEHDISQYVYNSDMLAQSGSWLAVIDTEQMAVLWTYWFDSDGRAFTDNSQRFYNKAYIAQNGGVDKFTGLPISDPSSGKVEGYFCQEELWAKYHDIISCYPMADEMETNFIP